MSYNKFAKDWHLLQSNNKNNFSHKLLEKPAIKDLLPNNIQDGNVLLLGCGSGEEIEIFDKDKYKYFLGIDNSETLIEYAKYNYPKYDFEVGDLNEWSSKNKFDVIFSSLTFHYINDWDSMFKRILPSLKENGEIIFSCHHPIKWGGETKRSKNINKFILGYEKIKTTSDFKVYGDYLNAREIHDKLFGKIDITHYHKPISMMVDIFIKNNLEIIKMVEPKPIIESKTSNPDFYETYSKIPLFVLFKLRKKQSKI